MRRLGYFLLPPLLLTGCGGPTSEADDPAPAPSRPPATADPTVSGSPALPSRSATGAPDRPGPAAVPHEDEGVSRQGPVATRRALCVLDGRPGFSFDGTVTAIGDGQVTFEVQEWFAGGDRSATYVVEMGAPVEGRASESGPSYSVGTRLLVRGSRGQAWGCGETVYYDEETAADRRS